MDTKLKSRRKLGIFLIIVTILSAAYVMLYNYDMIYEKAVEEAQKTYTTSLSDREYLESFLEFSYILYNQEISSKTGEAKMSQDEINDVADVWMEDYEALYPYLDYRIEDGSGSVLGRSTANTGNGLTDDSFKENAFGMVLTYDEHGNPDVKVVKSGEKTAQSIVLRKIIDNWSETVEDATHGELKTPKNRTYIYGMKKSSIEQYLNQWYWFGDEAPNDAWYMMLACMAAVCVAAWIFAQSETLKIGGGKIFQRGRLAAANGFCNLGRCICGHILGDNVYQCGSEDWAQKVCHGTDAGMAAVEGAEGRSSGGCRKSRTGRWETVPEGEKTGQQSI